MSTGVARMRWLALGQRTHLVGDVLKISKRTGVADYRIATVSQGKTQHLLKDVPEDRDLLELGDGIDRLNQKLLSSPSDVVKVDDDESKKALLKPDRPAPLPPVRYEAEISGMPTLLTAENALWFGAYGWDAPEFRNFSEEDRVAMFERRKKDLPLGFSYGGNRLIVVPNQVTGGLKVIWAESSSRPSVELAKRAAGRVARQFSSLDRNDDMFETRIRTRDNMLEWYNNKSSLMQYNKYTRKTMVHRDQHTGMRQYERLVSQEGYDVAATRFIESMMGTYKFKFADMEDMPSTPWRYVGGFPIDIVKKHLSRKQRGQERENPIWIKAHCKIEAVDMRFSLINYEGLDKFNGLKELRYLNLQGCRFIDDWAMTRLHPFSDTLEYLDLSETRITLRGFNYIHLMKSLKYLNLSNMVDITDEEMLEIIPMLRAVLPPDCSLVTSLRTNPEVPLLSSGDDPEPTEKVQELKNPETGELVVYEKTGELPVDVEKMWNLAPLSKTKDRNTERRRDGLMSWNYSFDKKTNETLLHYMNRANTKRPLW